MSATATPAKPAKPKSDAHAYLERRGWTKDTGCNVYRRIERADEGAGSVVERVVEQKLEPDALIAQQSRDIEALLSANAALTKRVADLEEKAATKFMVAQGPAVLTPVQTTVPVPTPARAARPPASSPAHVSASPSAPPPPPAPAPAPAKSAG